MNTEDVVINGLYKHYKGTKYKVEGFAKSEATGKELVLYRSTTRDDELWARPLNKFIGKTKNGQERFVKVEA